VYRKLPCQLPEGRRRFCSRACVGRSKRHGRVYRCAMCDSEFYRRDGEADGKLQFCSIPCYADWRKEHRSDTTYPRTGAVHTHRIVASAVLGRPLAHGEVVHHIDGVRTNNHPSNLAVFPDQSTHAFCHFGEMSDQELGVYTLSAERTVNQ